MTKGRSYVAREAIKRPRVHLVHDNGGQPFRVVATRESITVSTYSVFVPRVEEQDYSVLVKRFDSFLGYWKGHDPVCGAHGNSVLIDLGKRSYVSVGESVYRFRTDDEIVDFVSPLGRNDVPYPVAFGTENVYFMLDQKLIARDELATPVTVAGAETLYGEFYGHVGTGQHTKRGMKGVKVLRGRVCG